MSEKKAVRKRFVGLDFLKAVAAIFIVMHHYQQVSGVIFTTFNFYPASDAQLHLGFLTILFFMISGFLVEWQQQQEERVGKQTSLPGKLWHKCLRIYPMAMIACVVYVGLGILDWLITDKWNWIMGGGGIWTFFCSMTLNSNMGIWSSSRTIANAPTWYLSTLIFSCAVYYLLVYLCRRLKVQRLLMELILFLFLCAIRTQGAVMPFLADSWDQRGGMVSFFMGTLLCHLVPYISRRVKYFLLFISAGTLIVLLSGRGDWIEEQWWVQLFLLYPGIFINALYVQDSPDSKVCRMIHFFASTSFNVYVWHCPIFMAEMVLLDILGVSLPCTYGVMTVFVVVVELLAIPLYLFVEKPLAKYMKKYEWQNLRPVDPL